MDDATAKTLALLGFTLGSPGERIATLIREHAGQENALRIFARQCAAFALASCHLDDPVLAGALQSAQLATPSPPAEDEQLLKSLAKIVQRLDVIAWDAQEAMWAGRGSEEIYRDAFRQARAATSVLDCWESPAEQAAAESCYEAYFATDNAEGLLQIAERTLVQKSGQ